jgi:UDPglucose 6-dehydrogenase
MQHTDMVIVGFGVVGHNMALLFPDAAIHDPPKGLDAFRDHALRYSIAIVCVPTDMLADGSCDTSIVTQVIDELDADVFLVKSTVPPGTCKRLSETLGKRIVFSPEFFGGTQHANAVDYDFVILGGERPDTDVVAEAYKHIKSGSYRIAKTDWTTAELVKYAENSFLFTKVRFFVEFYHLAQAIGVDVDEFRELLLLDPRIGRSHTFTYRGHPFSRSHCLDKDCPAIVHFAHQHGISMPALEAAIEANDKAKEGAQ